MSRWRRSSASQGPNPLRPGKRPRLGVSSSVRIRIDFSGSCLNPQPKQFSEAVLHPNAEVSLGGTSATLVLVLFSAMVQCFLLHLISASSKRASALPGTQHKCTFRAGRGVAYFHRRPENPEAPQDRPLSCTVAGVAASPSGARARRSPLPRVLCRLLWGHQSSAPA